MRGEAPVPQVEPAHSGSGRNTALAQHLLRGVASTDDQWERRCFGPTVCAVRWRVVPHTQAYGLLFPGQLRSMVHLLSRAHQLLVAGWTTPWLRSRQPVASRTVSQTSRTVPDIGRRRLWSPFHTYVLRLVSYRAKQRFARECRRRGPALVAALRRLRLRRRTRSFHTAVPCTSRMSGRNRHRVDGGTV